MASFLLSTVAFFVATYFLRRYLDDIGIPNGIGAVGYTEADIPELVPGTMKQQRLLSTCARTPTEDDIAEIFARSMANW